MMDFLDRENAEKAAALGLAQACPVCGSSKLAMAGSPTACRVVCQSCLVSGPTSLHYKDAVAVWNRLNLAPQEIAR